MLMGCLLVGRLFVGGELFWGFDEMTRLAWTIVDILNTYFVSCWVDIVIQ